MGYWSSLGSHLKDARREAEAICDGVGLMDGPIRTAVVEAAGLHDLGKAHPAWQAALPGGRGADGPLAKCPPVLRVEAALRDIGDVRAEVHARLPDASALPDGSAKASEVAQLRWAIETKLDRASLAAVRAIPGVRRAVHEAFRPGLRHEAASALAMWRAYRDGDAPYPALAVYLAAAHHGKVRTVLRATTPDGGDVFGVKRAPDTLEFDGRSWPMDFTPALDGAEGEWTDEGFVLTDHGWTGLVADLLGSWREATAATGEVVPLNEPRALGPFALAWLEALVRVADWRASERRRPGEGRDDDA